MKRLSLILLALSLIAPLSAGAAKTDAGRFKAFDWGVRFGFGARTTNIQTLIVDGHEIEDYTKNNQVGYNAAVFARYNRSNVYFQAEGAFLHSRTSISFDRNSWNTLVATQHNTAFSTDGTALRTGVVMGYKIINQYPYTMSIYTGPTAEHLIESKTKTEFSGFASDDLYEELKPVQLAWKTGLECTIGRAILNFEYQKGIHNISDGIYDNSTGQKTDQIVLDRTNGVLSFSVGLIF